MTRPELVTYDGLPASSGGAHGMRTRRPSAARTAVDAFLAACTVPAGAASTTFRIWAGGPGQRSEHWRLLASDLLGGPRRTERTHMEWGVRDDRIDDVFSALDAATPADVTTHGRPLAVLAASTPVRLVDPTSGRPYEGVSPGAAGEFAVDGYGRILGASGVRASFGTSGAALSLWLCFPGDERLAAAAAHVQTHAPVRLSSRQWRRWAPTRSGDGYRSSRIPSPIPT